MNNLFYNDVAIEDIAVAKKLIKESVDGFLKLFDNSPTCMSITSMGRRTYVRVNKKFLERFGYVEEEIIGRTSTEIGILNTKESNKVATILSEKGKIQNEIIICIAKNGELVYTVSSIEKMEIQGETYLISSFLDITKIVEQQNIIEQQNKEILDSINYARHIQNSIFPSQKQIAEFLPESFILSKPKNIVSGDFYCVKKRGEKIFVSACDCTGHGVPGALISIVGFKLLSKFIDEHRFSSPAEILNQLNTEFEKAIANAETDSIQEIKDGMDIALCTIDKSTLIMQYAGAYNPIYIVRSGKLVQLEVDKIPIHLFTKNTGQVFTNYEIKIKPNDVIYLFSDGYPDQFGGPKNKKFKHKNFKDLILSIHFLPMEEQKEIFDKTLEEWKSEAGEEQTDDVLIVGFKI
jgi:PAS domain S-box-containing protein